jgi:hypothetical protein
VVVPNTPLPPARQKQELITIVILDGGYKIPMVSPPPPVYSTVGFRPLVWSEDIEEASLRLMYCGAKALPLTVWRFRDVYPG